MTADKKRLGEQMSKKIRGILAFTVLAGLSLLLLNCGTSTSRPAGVLFVLSQGTSAVGSYAINLDSGGLSLINSTASTCPTAPCSFPADILLDPTGKIAFVMNQGDPGNNPPVPPSILAYTVKDDGTLSATGTATQLAAGSTAVAMTRNATGTFLYVASQDPAAISVFAMQSGSASLTLVETDPLTYVPTSVAASSGANGGLLYVTGNKDLVGVNDNTVSEYSVDANGHLASLIGSPYTVGSDPGAVLAVKTAPVGGSGGLFVYVANSGNGAGGNSLSVFSVCTVTNATCSTDDVTNATMLPVGGAVSVGLAPMAMTVDPTNSFLFVVNHGSSTVSGFKINATTGVLSALNPASASTGSGPVAISMHSSGKFLFVSNNASSNISGFNVDTTSGKMSTAINVTSAAQPAGLAAK